MKKLFLLLIPFALTACADDNSNSGELIVCPPTISFNPHIITFAETNNDFGNKMMKNLCTDISNKNKNVTFSPYSMNLLLGMIANGASDIPQQELLKETGYNTFGIDTINDYNKELARVTKAYAGSAKLEIANAAWIQDGMAVKDSFMNAMRKFYSSDIQKVDFTQTTTTQDIINRWCNEKTNGMIKKTSLDVSPDMRVVLANATYFKAEWKNKFNKDLTHKAEFTNQSGTKSVVDMMTTNDNFVYTKTDSYQLVQYMRYAGSNLSMSLVLPAEGVNIDSLIGKVNMKHNNTDYKINLTMPKFKIESHWKEFDKTLNALGINKIMAEGDNMNRLAKNLYVSKICQDVAVDVNEDGTEAAAVSTGGMYTTAINPDESLTITFNRPFLFYIVENDTGSVLFMGKIANL